MRATLALSILLALGLGTVTGCVLGRPGVASVSPSDVPGAEEVAVRSATDRQCASGEVCYPLAFVAPGDEVSVCLPWDEAPRVVGRCLPGAFLTWGAFASGDGADAQMLFPATDCSLVLYQSESDGLRVLPARTEPGAEVYWFPNDSIGLEVRNGHQGVLTVLSFATGEVEASVPYYGSWSYRPSGRFVAFGRVRSGLLAKNVDLALLDGADGSVSVLVKGDRRHYWVPIGWASPELLAYRNALVPDAVRWVRVETDVPTGGGFGVATSVPEPSPALPLALDPMRAAGLVPRNLKAGWTGWFAVSPDEQKLAIASTTGDEPTSVYVGDLATGIWHLIGPGGSPCLGQGAP